MKGSLARGSGRQLISSNATVALLPPANATIIRFEHLIPNLRREEMAEQDTQSGEIAATGRDAEACCGSVPRSPSNRPQDEAFSFVTSKGPRMAPASQAPTGTGAEHESVARSTPRCPVTLILAILTCRS